MTEANTRKNLLVSLLIALWTRLPVVVQAILTGLILAAVGTIPWALLVSTNAKHWSAIPLSVAPAALYLLIFLRFVRGEGWPRSIAEAPRMRCRGNPPSGEGFGVSFTAC